jgi:NAD(P)-dependent dehydrogenase (short-subunit alcohol dehydrogenase family)
MQLATAKAVVTGGASGLGFATAQRVIDAGGQVVLLDINDELGAASANKLGDRATYINTDVASEDSVRAAIGAADETMGGITLAVNCARSRRTLAQRAVQQGHPGQPGRQLQRHQGGGCVHGQKRAYG